MDVPKPVIKEEAAAPAPLMTTTEIGFDSFVSDPPQTELLDEYQPFPLGGMDLGGFTNVGRTNGESGDWGQIQNLIGGETDVAPTLDQAADQTQTDTELDQGLPQNAGSVREIAAAAGDMVDIQPVPPSPEEHPASELTAVEPQSDGTLDKPDVSQQVSDETIEFGSIIDSADQPSSIFTAPSKTVDVAPTADVPQQTTLAPAADASAEDGNSTSTSGTSDSDTPAADGI